MRRLSWTDFGVECIVISIIISEIVLSLTTFIFTFIPPFLYKFYLCLILHFNYLLSMLSRMGILVP